MPVKGGIAIDSLNPYALKGEAGKGVASAHVVKDEINPLYLDMQREAHQAIQQVLVPQASVPTTSDGRNDSPIADAVLQSTAEPKASHVEMHDEPNERAPGTLGAMQLPDTDEGFGESPANMQIATELSDRDEAFGDPPCDIPIATRLPDADERFGEFSADALAAIELPDRDEAFGGPPRDIPIAMELPDVDEGFGEPSSDAPIAAQSPDVDDTHEKYARYAPMGVGLGAIDDEVGDKCIPDAHSNPSKSGGGKPEMTWSYHQMPELDDMENCDPRIKGLLYFKKWWYLRDVDISVKGELLCGTPIMFREKTLRVVNDAHSYFIPAHNIDYIRTPDGLEMSEFEFE